MATAALDASALLALMLDEPGAEVADAAVRAGVISAVNWCEVAQKLLQKGHDAAEHAAHLTSGGMAILPFTRPDADAAAALWARTRSLGLSLADRACLALARRVGVPAYTADRRWADLDLGIDIVVIR